MELIYNASISGKLRRDWVQEESPICSLSSRNIIAIASSSICASSCDTDRRLSAPLEVIYEVCVCDIDRPWELHHVTSHTDKIVALEWHKSGTKLLIATSSGKCEVWEMKDYLLNVWTRKQHNEIVGEEVISIAWLHDGVKVVFNADRKESVVYIEKVARMTFAPSLSHFGAKPISGWLAITATGLVSATVFETDASVEATRSASLMTTRHRVVLADIAHDASGNLLLVTSDGNISSAVQCYRVSLSVDPTNTHPCIIDCSPIASFYVNCHTDASLRASPSACITHVRYMAKELGDTVIVGAGDHDSSHVELWNLVATPISLHRVYQTDAADSTHQTQQWAHQSSITHVSLPVAIAVPQFPVRSAAGGAATLFQYVAIGYHDGSVKLVNKHSFQPMTTTNLDMGITECDGVGDKPKAVAHMTDMRQTVTGAVLLGIDQYSCVYVMKAANTRDPVSQVPPHYLVAMLEYLIVGGYDWWDIEAAVRPGVVEVVIQKLCENFCHQPVITQQHLLPRFLAVKASLYRCSSSGQQKSVDCLCRLLVHSISTFFRLLLRPKVIIAAEKSPSEKLTQSCAKIPEADIDKLLALSGLDKRDYVVESSTLQCLQKLIQWLTDLTVYLLTSLPLLHTYGLLAFPGLSLLHDVSVLACLRELLVIVRMWGAMNPGCLPHFTCTCVNLDCLALLFKLLTQVWLVAGEGAANRVGYDDGLLDDCCLLQSQVRAPSAHQGMFGHIDYSTSILSQQHPMTFTFGVAPKLTSKGISLPSVTPERQSECWQKRDIIRQLNLGMGASEPTKTCSRCDSSALVHAASFKSATMNMWDRQWARYCLCGGHWKLDKC